MSDHSIPLTEDVGELARFQQHPLSAIFPPMPAADFAALRSDIAQHGLRQPIILFQGKVLDGWHRVKGCSETGTAIATVNFEGDERAAQDFVLSANLARRHLATSDRAIIAAKLATLRWGERKHRSQMTPLTIEEAAERVRVSAGSVTRARKVLARGNPELIARVEANELTISKAESSVAAVRSAARRRRGLYHRAMAGAPRRGTVCLAGSAEPEGAAELSNPTEDGNSIDWARWSFSVVTGCKHDCPYCYITDFVSSVPMFHPDRLSAPMNIAPPVTNDIRDRRVFAGSLADMFGRWVLSEWIEAIIDVFRACPAWIFIICTKFPQRLLEFPFPQNVWIGTTIDKQERVASAEDAFAQLRERDPERMLFAAIEPMFGSIRFNRLHVFNRLVLGGASATQHSPAWYPPLRLVDDKRREARAAGVSLYEKSNLLLKELLNGARYEFSDEPPAAFHHYLGKKP